MILAAPPPEIIRLTAQNPYRDRLPEPMGSSEKRSPLCGSRVVVDVSLDPEGRVDAVGMRVNACAFGQASATLLARGMIGRTPADLARIRDELGRWIAGEGGVPDWPDVEHLRPERLTAVRKQSVQLAFQAAAEAAERAAERTASEAGAA